MNKNYRLTELKPDIRWTKESFLRIKEQDPRLFARGYQMLPFSDSERAFPSFKSCYSHGVVTGEIARRGWPIFIGVDLSGKSRAGNVIFVLAVDPHTQRRYPIEILNGAWSSPETAEKLVQMHGKYPNTRAIIVESNGYQQSLIDWMQSSPGVNTCWFLIDAFVTGGLNKNSKEMGVKSLEVEFKNKAWVIPADEFEGHNMQCKCGWCMWTSQMIDYPQSLNDDHVMACFSADTKFFDGLEIKKLKDCVNTDVQLLGSDNKYHPGTIKSFGVQNINSVKFKVAGRSKLEFDFSATANHRWFTTNRGEVTDLRVGDSVQIIPNQEIEKDSEDFKHGFVHGFIFGDGAKSSSGLNRFQLRLCGKKAIYTTQFEKFTDFISLNYPKSAHGDPVVYLKSDKDFKSLPDHKDNLNYQAGFLDGWLKSDGATRNRITTTDHIAADWLQDRAPLLGYCLTGRHTYSSARTNFGPRSASLISISLSTKNTTYKVISVDFEKTEEVFCAVEPKTASFTLAGGFLTGNCWFAREGVSRWGAAPIAHGIKSDFNTR